jgi:hypothetical protein
VTFGGLDLCSCKRGFFTLRNCANSATATCRSCTRRICPQHLAEPDLCVECAARAAEDRTVDYVGDPTFAANRYRSRWYDSSGYQPVFWGTPDTFWTDDDYRWYDEGIGGGDFDDDDGGGFSDS